MFQKDHFARDSHGNNYVLIAVPEQVAMGVLRARRDGWQFRQLLGLFLEGAPRAAGWVSRPGAATGSSDGKHPRPLSSLWARHRGALLVVHRACADLRGV